MSRCIKIAVIIPAYNEEASIASVISDVNSVRREDMVVVPIVVNDFSQDRTAEIVSQLKCVTLHLPVNLGIGGAVQTGVKYAFNNDFDLAVQIDADGQHPPAHIPRLFEELQKNSWDVVIGSRFIDRKGFQSTFCRRAGIQFLQWLIKLITRRTVTDPTSGMRLMNRRAMAVVCEFYPDEYPEPEALILYHRHNLNFGETPVQMKERAGGKSSIQGLQGFYYVFKVTIAIIFTYLRR
jgi:glycosyltransferase involved in cell wall biosynthesis